jgi:hypothetical protein
MGFIILGSWGKVGFGRGGFAGRSARFWGSRRVGAPGPIIGPGHCSAPPSAPSLAPARDKSGSMCVIGVEIRRLPSLTESWELELEFGLQ